MATTDGLYDSRVELHKELVRILGNDHVYFQPPEGFRMEFPCIVYSRRSGLQQPADNRPYVTFMQYDVTLMDRDPDDGIIQRLIDELRGSRYDRHYTSQNLHHDVIVVATHH